MLNKCEIIGHLGRDPEAIDGAKVAGAKFSVAVSDYYGSNKETTWFNVICWDKQATTALEFLKKGSKVYVAGRIKVSNWEKDGEKRSKFELVASRVLFLDRAGNKGDVGDAEIDF